MLREAQQMSLPFCKYAKNLTTNRKEKVSLFLHTLDNINQLTALVDKELNLGPD